MLRSRLHAKVMLGVSLVLLPLLGLLPFGLVETHEMRQASTLTSLGQTAHTAGRLVDAALQDARGLAWTIAAEPSPQELEPRRLRGFSERVGRERTERRLAEIIDARLSRDERAWCLILGPRGVRGAADGMGIERHVPSRTAWHAVALVPLCSGALIHHVAQSIRAIAMLARIRLQLVPGVGDFLPHGAPLFEVCGDAAKLEVEARTAAVGTANERILQADTAFGFRQRVDVAGRARSPGINDPTTAVQALDPLQDLPRFRVHRRFPSLTHRDAGGRGRRSSARARTGARTHASPGTRFASPARTPGRSLAAGASRGRTCCGWHIASAEPSWCGSSRSWRGAPAAASRMPARPRWPATPVLRATARLESRPLGPSPREEWHAFRQLE